MRPRRAGSFSSTRTLLGAVGLAAIAGALAFACARNGLTGSDGDGGESSGPVSTINGGAGGIDGDGGSVGTSTSGAQPPNGVGVELFGATCNASQTTVDFSPMRRVSRVEYNNMVRDLLGDQTQPANGFPPESPLGHGINLQANTYGSVSTAIVQQYMQAAETLAASVVADTNRMNNFVLAGISSCGQAKDDTCAQDFVSTWVNRAYRGQLDATESTALNQIYSTVKAQFDWTTGIQAIITTVLESPRFLYVMEFGSGTPSGNVVALSQTETAARLAFFLWRSVPDATLMADAAAGKLATPAGVLAEAQRMLTVKSSVTSALMAQDAVQDFTNQWMQLTGTQAKDAQYTKFNANASTLSEAMYQETRLDVSQAVLAENGTLPGLFTSTSSYINSDLAGYYGATLGGGTSVTVSDAALSNTTFTKTPLDNRPGLLTTGGVLTTQAHSTLPSFVLRGKLVRENVLCDPIPDPPPNVPAGPTMAPDGGTTRSLLLGHMQKGTACPTCHVLMDPIGVGFGNFDATGQYQATDANGFASSAASPFPAIDSSGTIYRAAAGEIGVPIGTTAATFMNVNDLTTQLAAAAQVSQCFALNEFRYALGRLETTDDACSAQQIYTAFSSNDFNIQQLLLAITQTDAFRYRVAASACQ
jgi:hypothetical protein